MKSLAYARSRARACRERVAPISGDLVGRIIDHLWNEHGLEVLAVPASSIHGSRAEIRIADAAIYYDEDLDRDPSAKLLVLAHELGHLELHGRLTQDDGLLDPVLGSAYLNTGESAIARYSPKAKEEAEANAFALEFVCPSNALFDKWSSDSTVTASHLAEELRLPVWLVRLQLAEGLNGIVNPEGTEYREREEPQLNPEQIRAAHFTSGPALVNAGPGTGKTATLIERIRHLLRDRGERPDSLLVLTFSNDAAEEVRSRIGAYLGDEAASSVEVLTFHALGVQMLRAHGDVLGIRSDAVILDEIGQRELLDRVVGHCSATSILDFREPSQTSDGLLRHIRFLKDRDVSPVALRAVLHDGSANSSAASRDLLTYYEAYEQLKSDANSVDFGDLIMAALEILRRREDISAAYHAKYRWILVDEYQDTGPVVAKLLKKIAGDGTGVWVVGDIRQAIYLFRGAEPENVVQFPKDFPGAEQFNLQENYRSCPEIVAAAGQLASTMTGRGSADPMTTPSWIASSGIPAIGRPPVLIAHAVSDAAEHAGIVEVVRSWVESGVPGHHIAVLARRNVDVRNIALALGRAKVSASAAGVITPDGAAGDLAAVLTLAGATRASKVRTVSALGQTCAEPTTIHEAVRLTLDPDADMNAALKEAVALAGEVESAVALAQDERFSADAFEALAAFLFDSSHYLRRIIGLSEPVRRQVLLGEVTTTLAMAAGYRFTHPNTRPWNARIGFAEHLRTALRLAAPSPMAARETEGAVRVMTCHASKGLEFPCVAVAAQTLPAVRESYPWLPNSLKPPSDEDAQQADSLLFVSLTRARQAVVVCRSLSRSGNRETRKPVPLLVRWQEQFDVPTVVWSNATQPLERIEIGPIWGEPNTTTLSVRTLNYSSCAVRTYIEDGLRLRFSSATPSLYPVLIGRTRDSIRRVMAHHAEIGRPLTPVEADALILEAWPDGEFKDHPHKTLYSGVFRSAVQEFNDGYHPSQTLLHFLDLDFRIDGIPDTLDFRLDLITIARSGTGELVGIALHFDTLIGSLDKKTQSGVLWSKVSLHRKLPLVLAHVQHRDKLVPQIYSIRDRRAYPLLLSSRNREAIEELTNGAIMRAVELAENRYLAVIEDWDCERCSARLLCPIWPGLV